MHFFICLHESYLNVVNYKQANVFPRLSLPQRFPAQITSSIFPALFHLFFFFFDFVLAPPVCREPILVACDCASGLSGSKSTTASH